MVQEYAKTQPAGFNNVVQNVAIVGAGGRQGVFIAEALIQGGKHKVTAITRPESTSKMPDGLHETKHVNYDSRLSLVEALKGQDVLIITMSVFAPPESQTRLIDAAVEAGVKWILPNEWGSDAIKGDEENDSTGLLERLHAIRKHIEKVGAGKTHWIGILCGFWYQFSLAGTEARYGFDFDEKKLTFFDNGKTKIITTTWPQVARAVANLLALKVLPEDENDKSPTLSRWSDKGVYILSFYVSQQDMFESVLRATGGSEKDWTITHEDVKERFERGSKIMEGGNLVGFVMKLYSRVFFPNGGVDFREKLDNDVLDLPKEDLDEATKEAVIMAKDKSHLRM